MKPRRLWPLLVMALSLAVWSCHTGDRTSPNAPKAVVLVIIDTVAASHVHSYGYPLATTPHLDEFAKDAILFKDTVSASPWTLPSIGAIFTGAFPSRSHAGLRFKSKGTGDRTYAKLREDFPTLAQVFKDHDYQTAGVFNNPHLNPAYGLDRGFDTYDYYEGDMSNSRRADQVSDAAIQWIKDKGAKPFFLVVHYMDPHMSYDPPEKYWAPFVSSYRGGFKAPFDTKDGLVAKAPEDRRFARGLYDGEIAFTDAELFRFFSFLKERGLYDQSLIVVVADHGEEFWEHGGFRHGYTLYEEVIKVPLLVKLPGKARAGETVTEVVSLVDIFPSILEFMGWRPPRRVDGTTIFSAEPRPITPRTVFSEDILLGPELRSFRFKNMKYIFNRETGALEIYDLEKDPAEKTNLADQLKVPDDVMDQIKAFQAALEKDRDETPMVKAVPDRKNINALKSLGYIQ